MTTTYYPRVIPVHAVEATEPETWTTRYGDPMQAEPGDVILSDARKRWTVKPDIFARTYRPLGDGTYTKCTPIQVEISSHEQVIETLEGPQTVRAGDAIVHGIAGELYSMSPDRLAERYTVTPPA